MIWFIKNLIKNLIYSAVGVFASFAILVVVGWIISKRETKEEES